jgi:hypothetical protein
VFEQLRETLNRKANRLSDPINVALVAEAISDSMVGAITSTSSTAGVRTGRMVDNLGYVSPVTFTGSGYRVGVGQKKSDEERQAESGTISAFLQDYPQYRGGFGFTKSMAWWSLSSEAKDVLAGERMMGRYGGEIGKSPYWVQQNQGMAEVGIEPRHFVDGAVQGVGAKVVRIIQEALRE